MNENLRILNYMKFKMKRGIYNFSEKDFFILHFSTMISSSYRFVSFICIFK